METEGFSVAVTVHSRDFCSAFSFLPCNKRQVSIGDVFTSVNCCLILIHRRLSARKTYLQRFINGVTSFLH